MKCLNLTGLEKRGNRFFKKEIAKLETYFKSYGKLEGYYRELFRKYAFLKPTKVRIKKRHTYPTELIRPNTLRRLVWLFRKMREEGIIICKTDSTILLQLTMKWLGCSKRVGMDYVRTLELIIPSPF